MGGAGVRVNPHNHIHLNQHTHTHTYTSCTIFIVEKKREMHFMVFVVKETPKLVICRSSRFFFLLTSAQELLKSSLEILLPGP